MATTTQVESEDLPTITADQILQDLKESSASDVIFSDSTIIEEVKSDDHEDLQKCIKYLSAYNKLETVYKNNQLSNVLEGINRFIAELESALTR